MRHRKGFNHLGRKKAHRKAMLSNMAASLIMDKRIKTTVAKAKALRTYVEPLITKSKDDTTHSRRVVFSYMQNKESVSELFREVAVKAGNRPGGYTRIIKTGSRLGDNAEMCIIELVDYNELMLAEKDASAKTTAKKSRRRSRKKTAPALAETTESTVQADETDENETVATEEISDVEQTAVEKKKEAALEAKEEQKIETKDKVGEKKEPTAEKKEEAEKDEPKAEARTEEKLEAKKEEKQEEDKMTN